MLALVITLLFAVYLLGPELLARWILGFVVQRKSLVQTKSEEITRAIMWAVVPLILAYIWASRFGHLWSCGSSSDIQTFFSGIANESFFQQNRAAFFSAANAVAWMNICVLWRLYGVVLLASGVIDCIILNYGSIRYRLREYPRLRQVLATFVVPRVSEWHLLLSDMLLPNKNLHVRIDAMTKGGLLYQGQFADRLLGPDGDLISITLREPRRFKREQYLEALKANPATKVDDFWKTIPGNIFVIMGSDISTLNVRYTPNTVTEWADLEEFKTALKQLYQQLTAIEAKRSQKSE